MRRRILSIAVAFMLCLSLVPSPARAAESPSAWAETDVNKAIAENLVPQALQSGYTQVITRAEFTALAVAMYETVTGSEITGRTKFNDTTDVNVEKAASIGVVSGTGNQNFSPDAGLSREQAATMLARLAEAAGKPLTKQAAGFADNGSISSWALEAVGQMQADGIMGGVGGNAFAPQGDYTREQSILTVLRLYHFVKDGATQSAAPETAPPASYKDYGVSSAVTVPDFGDVTGTALIETLTYKRDNYGYQYFYNLPKAGAVKDFANAMKQAGFTSDAKEEHYGYFETNARWWSMYFYYDTDGPHETMVALSIKGDGEDRMQVSVLVPVTDATITETYTIAQSKGYPVYDEFPEIPDFGAVFGVEPLSAEPGILSSMFAYRYDANDVNEAARSMTGSSYTSSQVTEEYYEEILKNCGFTEAIRKSNGGDLLKYWEWSGYSIRIALSGEYDRFNNRVITPFRYSIIIQKL